MFLGLITRCKDEFFVKEFCDYYLSQGVDKIFVIDDNSNDKSIYNNIDDKRIDIIYKKDIIKNKFAWKFYEKIKSQFEWMIYCDVDEFITTKLRITNTIRDELETTFKDADCVQVPWVMMASNSREKNPSSVLLENIYRWNHDKRHVHPNGVRKFRCRYNQIEVKCIFKTDKWSVINDDHYPGKCSGSPSNRRIVDSIDNRPAKQMHEYSDLREHHINNGALLCYHYRVISKENSISKLKNNCWYSQARYTLDDINASDHSEIIDETLKYKVLGRVQELQADASLMCRRFDGLSGSDETPRISHKTSCAIPVMNPKIIDKELKFVHITKTSGTYIEELGIKHGLCWGKYDKYLEKRKIPKNSNPSYWHLPLQFFDSYPYQKHVKLFTIVRNPYDRIISECLCKWGGKFSKKMETKGDLNLYIKQQINKKKTLDLSFHHFLQQHLYTHNEEGEKIVDYIIKFEEMDKFNALMKDYSIDIEYIFNNKKKSKFDYKDISEDNIKLINEVYHLDFKYYNYKKLAVSE